MHDRGRHARQRRCRRFACPQHVTPRAAARQRLAGVQRLAPTPPERSQIAKRRRLRPVCATWRGPRQGRYESGSSSSLRRYQPGCVTPRQHVILGDARTLTQATGARTPRSTPPALRLDTPKDRTHGVPLDVSAADEGEATPAARERRSECRACVEAAVSAETLRRRGCDAGVGKGTG